MSKSLLALLGSAALVAVLAIGLSQTHPTKKAKPSSLTPAQIARRLSGSPPPLAALHAQSSRLLPGGKKALEARLASLKGHPVVLNIWASWCGPCRAEFPFFQNLSVKYGRSVGFVGLDAGDNHGDAARFLSQFPVSYPSYQDPSEHISLHYGATSGYPITVFFDARGKQTYEHQGGYSDQRQMDADIARYTVHS
jgi:thiol-disulfide isomerase/thioredoxin